MELRRHKFFFRVVTENISKGLLKESPLKEIWGQWPGDESVDEVFIIHSFFLMNCLIMLGSDSIVEKAFIYLKRLECVPVLSINNASSVIR